MSPSGEQKTMTEKKIWSMDELVALTDAVQKEEIEYKGGMVKFHFCELTEKEEPKFTGISDDMPEDEKMEKYQEIGNQRVLKMILKANGKEPENNVITEEQWALLPTTLRYSISNKILGVEDTVAENFRD